MAVSLDGKHVVTASRDSTARVWRLSDGACLHTLMGHPHWVFSAMVSADGMYVVTASSDMTARVWDLSGGKCLRTLNGHTGGVWSATFVPVVEISAAGAAGALGDKNLAQAAALARPPAPRDVGLLHDEGFLFACAASHQRAVKQPASRGQLRLTRQRLEFEPHGAPRLVIALAAVSALRSSKASVGNVMAKIVLASGESHIFTFEALEGTASA